MTRNRLLSIFTPLLLLALWELAVALGWLNRIFFPPPSEVLISLGEMLGSGELAANVGSSALRVGLGFVLGAAPAVLLGLLMGVSPATRAIVQPIAAAIYPVPKIALLPLVIVVLGLGESSRIVTIAVSVFFMVVLNVAASVTQVDRHFFEVARTFGANKRDLFWTVALPGSLPGIMASLKLGMGFALTLIVGVEFVGASDGIGWLIWHSYELYAIDRMLAGMIVIAFMGWLVTLLLDEVEDWLIPWQRAAHKETTMQERFRIWWKTLRPWSYTASVIPVALGGVIAAYHGYFDLGIFTLALIGSIAIHAGTNLANEYFDDIKGIDKVQVLGIGGAIQRGDLAARQVLIAAVAAFALGSAIGLYLVSVSGPFIFWLGLASVLVGFFYTAGPFALAYNGLGEVAVFIFMGPVMVIGSYYVQTRILSPAVILASLPVGFLVAAILHANNLRDLEIDRQFGKRTLATILGRAGANVEYYVLIGGTYLSLLVLVAAGVAPWPTLISAITLPAAIKLMRAVARESTPPGLQPVLRQTAQLHARFGVLLVAGWLAAVIGLVR
jgi:1,4-dihydroxy-2-naphthoate octaprenyltransferase